MEKKPPQLKVWRLSYRSAAYPLLVSKGFGGSGEPSNPVSIFTRWRQKHRDNAHASMLNPSPSPVVTFNLIGDCPTLSSFNILQSIINTYLREVR